MRWLAFRPTVRTAAARCAFHCVSSMAEDLSWQLYALMQQGELLDVYA